MARKKKAPKQKFPDGIVVAVGKEPAYIAEYDPEFHDDEEGPYTLTPIDLHGSFDAHESEIRAITGAEVLSMLEANGDLVRAADLYGAGRGKPNYGFKVAPWVKDERRKSLREAQAEEVAGLPVDRLVTMAASRGLWRGPAMEELERRGYTERGYRDWVKAPKARAKRKKGSAARPHFGKSAKELCAIGDKACREELRLRGRDPKTGRKLHWG